MPRIEFRANTIYCGDCKEILASFPENSFDLIYIDPPFFTSKNYEVIFGNGYEMRGFQDAHWYNESGKRRQDIFVYLDWLKERVEACYRVLKDTGSFYIHCDWHANAYIRVYILDKVFEPSNFRNEIIWHDPAEGGGIPKNDFPRRHYTIFRYSKSTQYFYKPEFRPYSEGTIQRGRTKVKGKYAEEGLRPEGTPTHDVWFIKGIHSPTDPEKKGYPTQKPLALLKRIVETSSKEGNLILDPMCGCGTTIGAAQISKRQWIGIDISPTACKLMRNQIAKITSESAYIWNLPVTAKELKEISWMDFQNWACEALSARISKKLHKDMGIDGYTFFENAPISVKQSEDIGRPEVDKFQTAVRRYYTGSKKEMKGIIVAFSFTSDAYNEAKRAKMENDISIDLKTVKELLIDLKG